MSKDEPSTPDEPVAHVLNEKRRQNWLRDNAALLDAYARYVEREGVFSDGVRLF